MDVAKAAVLEERRRDEQPMVRRLLHERDDGGHPVRLRGEPEESRIVGAHRDLGVEILEQVAREPELREDGQPRSGATRFAKELEVPLDVLVDDAEARRDLSERDPDWLHGASLAGGRRRGLLVR